MPIPDYQTIMLPLLEFYEDEQEHHIREAIEHISKYFNPQILNLYIFLNNHFF